MYMIKKKKIRNKIQVKEKMNTAKKSWTRDGKRRKNIKYQFL